MKQAEISTHNITLSDTFFHEHSPVLTYKISYPYFTSKDNSHNLNTINLYYKERAMLLKNFCYNIIYPQATKAYQEQPEHFTTYELTQDYTITLMTTTYLSLYFDIYSFSGGAHGNTTRLSNTWNLENSQLLSLDDFFANSFTYQEPIINGLIAYISWQKENHNPNDMVDYFEDYKENVTNSFQPNNFYLLPEGIIIYFQQYEIAPYSNGIPLFLLPISY